MGTPTTQSIREKTGSFSNNYRGWNKFQTAFSLLYKTTPNIAMFRSEPDLLQATLQKSVQQSTVCSAMLLQKFSLHFLKLCFCNHYFGVTT